MAKKFSLKLAAGKAGQQEGGECRPGCAWPALPAPQSLSSTQRRHTATLAIREADAEGPHLAAALALCRQEVRHRGCQALRQAITEAGPFPGRV